MSFYYIIGGIILSLIIFVVVYINFFSEKSKVLKIENCVCSNKLSFDNCINKSNIKGTVGNIKFKLKHRYPEIYKKIQKCLN